MQNRSGFDQPEDLVCCLARDQNVEIAVSHSSIAAQNGDSENPRVLIITRDDRGKINAILSVNSGATHLNQANSVEVMFNNLTRFPWPRFMIGSTPENTLQSGVLCPERNRLDPALRRNALDALNTQPRYACLRDKPFANLTTLENDLLEFNYRSVVREIRGTPQFAAYKYATIAALRCQNFKPEDYLPSNALSVNLEAERANDRALASLAPRLAAREPVRTNVSPGAQRCTAPSIKAVPSRNFLGSSQPAFRQYVADTPARGETSEATGALRFLFEGRGLDMRNWSMPATPGYSSHPFIIGNFVLRRSIVDSELPNSSLLTIPGIRSSAPLSTTSCRQLQRLSLSAFPSATAPEVSVPSSNVQ